MLKRVSVTISRRRALAVALQEPFQFVVIAVREDADLGAAGRGSVDDAGVVELVEQDDIVGAGQRADGGEVGHVAGRQDEGGLGAFEGGQGSLQFGVEARVAADQSAAAATPAEAAGSISSGGGQARIGWPGPGNRCWRS